MIFVSDIWTCLGLSSGHIGQPKVFGIDGGPLNGAGGFLFHSRGQKQRLARLARLGGDRKLWFLFGWFVRHECHAAPSRDWDR